MMSSQKILTSLAFLAGLGAAAVGTGEAHAGVPHLVPVQAWLATAEGEPLDGPTTLTFALYSSATAVEPLWLEVRDGLDEVDVDAGLMSVYLGEVESAQRSANAERHPIVYNPVAKRSIVTVTDVGSGSRYGQRQLPSTEQSPGPPTSAL